jgi:outer membrane usher protein
MMRGVVPRLWPLLFACSLLVSPASAQDQRAFLEVTLNGVAKGDTLVVMREADALVSVKMLTESGMHDFGGTRETIAGEPFVSLRSLAPLVTFETNELDLALAITADPRLLGATVQDLQSGAPRGMVHQRARSGYLNYSLTAASSGEYDVFTESALSAFGGSLYTTASVRPAGVLRGLTSLTFDDRARLRRWVVGDSFAGGTALGGDALLGGLALGSEFSLAPYFVRYPTLSLTTPITTPSTVEVHVNGRLVRTETVQPGRLDLRNLPLTNGQNDTRVTVRDPFGGTRELSASYYLTTSVLAPGIHEYQYAVGFKRNGLGTTSWDYTAPALIARHRLGLTNWLSAGLRAEAERGLANSGAIVNLRLPFGEVEATSGVSRAAGELGTAAQLSYAFASRFSNLGVSVRDATAAYSVVDQTAFERRARRELSMYAAVPLPRGTSLNLQHAQGFGDGDHRQQRTSLSMSFRLFRIADLTASTTRSAGAQARGLEAAIGVMMSFGNGRGLASTSVVRGSDGTRVALDVQQAVPVNTGFGYQVHAETGRRNASSAALQYQGAHGRVEVRDDVSDGGQHHTSVNVSGALVGIGGGVYSTRAVRNSFALIRVPGVDGVRAYSSNQEIGRTSRGGNILVPDLLPYYGNELNIEDTDIPIDYLVQDVHVTLAPPYRGGAVVLFPVRRIQRTSGSVTIVTAAGDDVPEFGELTLVGGGESVSSPLGAKGEFYFENLPEGKHEASVTYDGGSCSFILTVPRSEEPALDLGTLRCTSTRPR